MIFREAFNEILLDVPFAERSAVEHALANLEEEVEEVLRRSTVAFAYFSEISMYFLENRLESARFRYSS